MFIKWKKSKQIYSQWCILLELLLFIFGIPLWLNGSTSGIKMDLILLANQYIHFVGIVVSLGLVCHDFCYVHAVRNLVT